MRNRRSVALGREVEAAVRALGGDVDATRYQRRAAQVRAMWADIADPVFLPHTNAVFIKVEDGRKKLIVYVDESIYAAELNARRELIKLQFLKRYREDIDEFKILISRGKYKQVHPFVNPEPPDYEETACPRTLDAGQRTALDEALERVEDPQLREALRRAAQADMEWKNGLKVKNGGQS